MLDYIKTYYIGTEDDGKISDISSSELVYINSIGAHGWADTCSKISWAYMNAELKSRFVNEPTKISLIVSDYAFFKRKEEDEYTSFDRIEFLVNNFRPPKNGCVVSLYKIQEKEEGHIFELEDAPLLGKKSTTHVEWPFQTHNVWPMKKVWDEDNSQDYFSFQRSETNTFVKERNSYIEDSILEVMEQYGYKIKFVDYTMHPEKAYDIILNAKTHISYIGASWHFAHYIGIPVIDYGEHVNSALGPGMGIFGLLGAPGYGKDRAQMTINKDNRFVEKRFKSVIGFGLSLNDLDKDELKTHIIKELMKL